MGGEEVLDIDASAIAPEVATTMLAKSKWWAAGLSIDVSGGLTSTGVGVEEWELLLELEVYIDLSLTIRATSGILNAELVLVVENTASWALVLTGVAGLKADLREVADAELVASGDGESGVLLAASAGVHVISVLTGSA
jgi:hypothetical protein